MKTICNYIIFLFVLCLPVTLLAQKAENVDTIKTQFAEKNFLEHKVMEPYRGEISRQHSTHSATSVSGEELKPMYSPNLGYALSGKLAGLHVVQKGGSQGNTDAPDLMIRGRQTFQDNGILILVDGVETKWSNLLVDEIESVTLLKDAASLVLYGQRGANGVLLITTKRGINNEKVKISLSTRFGWQQATQLPELLGNGDYAELYNEAMKSDGKDISNGYFKNQQIVDYFKSQKYPYLYPDVNWYDEVLKKSAFVHNYALTFSGGNNFAKYYAALGFMDTQGLYAHTNGTTNSNYDLKRYNIRTNIDLQLTKWLSSEVKFRGVIEDKIFPNADENSIWKTMGVFLPYAVHTPSGAWGGVEKYAENPVATIQQKGYKSINERTIDTSVKMIANLESLTPGLSIYGQIGFSNNYYMTFDKVRGLAYEELTPRPDKIIPGITPENEMPYDVTARGSEGSFSHSQNSGTQWNRTTIMAGADYSRYFNKHQIDISLNYFQELYKAAGNQMPYAKQNILGRANYSYNNRYFGGFAISYSGSENFPVNHRFGVFPAFSAGWIISNEEFMRHNTILTFFKLKSSIGLVGNDRTGSVGRFIYQQNYVSGGNYLFGENLDQSPGLYKEGILANPFVTWEKALKYDVGTEMTLFNRLSLSAEYFFEKRNDIYVQPNNYISALLGADINNMNEGKTQNQGIEIEAFWNDRVGDFSYYLGGRFSYAKNKIIDIKENHRPANEEYLYAKGRPINQPYILEAIGFFKDEQDIVDSPKQMFGNVQPGDIKYKDQNNDGFIDDNDRIPVGHTSYPEIYYGFDAGIGFKGFDLAISFQGAGNRSVSLLDNNLIIPFLNGGVKPTQWVKDNYWIPEKGDAALFPRLTTEENNNNYRPSTLWQRSGSYLRLKNIELGYTIPVNATRQIKIEKIRVFVSVINPFTWDKISELNVDPEVMDMFKYPVMKSYNMGFSVQF